MPKVLDFPKCTIDFLSKLSRNNNKEWFEEHRADFETHLYIPAQMFVSELGEKLKKISPAINAIPKTDKSIFRLHRDVRFSKNKSPYKTNLGMYFWEGPGKRMECSGYYVHIEPGSFFVGTGMYMFSTEQLKKYREVISNPIKAAELDSIVNKIVKKGHVMGGKTFKKVPRGFDKDYEYSDFYLYSGVYAGIESASLKKIDTDDLPGYCFDVFKIHLPLHNWLVKNML